MRRAMLGLVFVACAGAAHAQGYTERWRAITAPIVATERISWSQVRCTANNEVVAFGIAQTGTPPPAFGPADDELTNTIIIAKFSADGVPLWVTRDFSGPDDDIFAMDLEVDAAGNAYVSYNAAPNSAHVNSYASANGAFRWSHTVAVESSNERGVKLEVRSAGNSTFVYAGVQLIDSIRLIRFNSANGSNIQQTNILGANSALLGELKSDANGNPILAQIIDQAAVFRKLNQSFATVWTQTFPSVISANVSFNTETNTALGTMFGSNPDLVTLNGTNGAILNTFNMPQDQGGIFLQTPNVSGTWYIANNADGGIAITGLTPTLKPFASSLISKQPGGLVTDTSGQAHFANVGTQPLLFAVRRRAADGLFETAFPNGAIATNVATDSLGRVVAIGETAAGEGVVIQLDQNFLTNTDVILRDFTGTLSIEAPGVLANDSNWVGGALTVVTQPTEGTVTLNQDGSFQYVPGPNYDGTDQFQYRVTKNGVPRTATCVVKQLVFTQLAMDKASVVGEETIRGTLAVNNPNFLFDFAPAITLSSPVVSIQIPPRFRPGSTSSDFTLRTTPVNANTPVTVTATASGQSRTTSFTVQVGGLKEIVSVNNAPLIVGQSSILQVKLTGPAPVERVYEFNYTGMSGPQSLTIPAGQSSGSISVNVAASALGTTPSIKLFFANGPREFFFTTQAKPTLGEVLTVDPVIYAGTDFRVRVRLEGKAGTSSVSVALTDNSTKVTTPASVTVSPGNTVGNANCSATLLAANTNVTFTASLEGVIRTFTILVRPNLLENFTLQTNVVALRTNNVGTIFLNWVALGHGQVVEVTVDNPNLAEVPAKVTIPAGQTNRQFDIKTLAAGTVNISVRIGQKKLTRAMTITP